jgi:phage shock protein PspC (stress-responsive transcriptional regulator)
MNYLLNYQPVETGDQDMKDIFDEEREIHLDTRHKKLGGVCAGVANYLDVPRFWVRTAAVIGLLVHPPSVLLAYGLGYLILEDDPADYDEVIIGDPDV